MHRAPQAQPLTTVHPCHLCPALQLHPLHRPLCQPACKLTMRPAPCLRATTLHCRPPGSFWTSFRAHPRRFIQPSKSPSLARFEPVDLLAGSALDIADDDTLPCCVVCALPVVWARVAPRLLAPCAAFSRARLLPPGPAPVRTPAFPTGLPTLSARQSRELHTSALLHERTRVLLALVASQGGLIILENPVSSILWLNRQVMSWVRAHSPFGAAVAACQHGLDVYKSWLFWCNPPIIAALASVCPHVADYHVRLSGVRNPDGSFRTRDTACYPASLARSLAALCVPFLSIMDREFTAQTWLQLLPARFPWPPTPYPIQDGAGNSSTACHAKPQSEDVFRTFRHVWSTHLADSGLVFKVVNALSSGSKQPPLTDDELLPFLNDLRAFLRVQCPATWASLLHVEGQPFRLNLWHALSLIGKDPDAGLFRNLREGIPLGFAAPIPPCPVMHISLHEPTVVSPLEHCESAWKSALDHPQVVDELLGDELQQGWIRVVPGKDSELRSRCRHTAVGKLGVVLSDSRPPRLVVDSFISGATARTHLPNRSANPMLSDVRRCVPLADSSERFCALVLDVSKAHRRLKTLPADQGLLCFRHCGRLYQCLTLNFGARASGFYWARVAGLLVRLTHKFRWLPHSALIYVDDILALLEKSSAPLMASLLVVLLQVLRVPMSWRKAKLSTRVSWIGWQFDFRTYTVRLDPAKLQRLLLLPHQCRDLQKLSLSALEKLTGKLLWLSNLFRPFRPSLAPLYADQYCPPLVHVPLSPDAWSSLCAALSDDLLVVSQTGLASAPPGARLYRVAHDVVRSKADLVAFPNNTRRLWIQISDPSSPDRILSDASREVMTMWLHICRSGTDLRSLHLWPHFECEAFADACAFGDSAGLGGFVRLPCGKCLYFQNTFSRTQLHDMFPWFPLDGSPQHYIAAWELLSQCGLLHLLSCLFPSGHPPVHVTFRCDNSASDSASWKGLSLAKGLCALLRSFFLLQERQYISVHTDHVPGFKKDLADALSRACDPSLLGFAPDQICAVPWSVFPADLRTYTYPLELDTWRVLEKCRPPLPCRVKHPPENFGVLRSSISLLSAKSVAPAFSRSGSAFCQCEKVTACFLFHIRALCIRNGLVHSCEHKGWDMLQNLLYEAVASSKARVTSIEQ